MTSQSSLPIQYSTGLSTDIVRNAEKSYGTAQSQSAESRTSFQTQLNEVVIDVYERSTVNAAVPDERTGVDRRQSTTRRRSSEESTPLQSGSKVEDVNSDSGDQKINQSYKETINTSPTFSSTSWDKGKLVDTWV